jgi:hypothetical protein
VHPAGIILKENTAKSETFSYEWITVSKTDDMLRVSVAENTSDTVRSIRVCLVGDHEKDACPSLTGRFLYVTQYPKGND